MTPLAAIILPGGLIAESEFSLVSADTVFPQSPYVQHSVALRWIGQVSETGDNITIVGKDIQDIWKKLNELNPDFEDYNARQLLPERSVISVADGPYQVIKGDNWVYQYCTYIGTLTDSLTRILAHDMQPQGIQRRKRRCLWRWHPISQETQRHLHR